MDQRTWPVPAGICPVCGVCLPGFRRPGRRVRCEVCRSWTFQGMGERGGPGLLRRVLSLFSALWRPRPAAGWKAVRSLALEAVGLEEIAPRRSLDLDRQRLLERSVERFGVIVPIVVRPTSGGYQLVTGHRRYLAARAVGLTTVPAVIRKLSRSEAEVYRYLENCAADPPGPLEEADGFERLFLLDSAADLPSLSRKLCLDRDWIQSRLELLSLPLTVQDALAHRLIDPNQARVLARLQSGEEISGWVEKMCRGEASIRDLMEYLGSRAAGRARGVERSPDPLDVLEQAMHEHQA